MNICIIGLTLEQAEIKLKTVNNKFYVSINKKDGEIYFQTCDFNLNRFNVEVEDEIIVKFNGRG